MKTKIIRLFTGEINKARIRIVRRGVIEPQIIETDTKAIPAPTKPNGRSDRTVLRLFAVSRLCMSRMRNETRFQS